jgi:ketosteroid isomerase-like protein
MARRLLPLAAVLLSSNLQAAPPEPTTAAGVAAEVEKGVAAYNAQDLKYYEATLSPDAVYIADDGATFAGKERVLGLFGRLFAATPKRQMAVSDVITGGKGDVAWARFKWTITRGETSRKGVCSVLFIRAGTSWQAVQIQNTPDGHGSPEAHH